MTLMKYDMRTFIIHPKADKEMSETDTSSQLSTASPTAASAYVLGRICVSVDM